MLNGNKPPKRQPQSKPEEAGGKGGWLPALACLAAALVLGYGYSQLVPSVPLLHTPPAAPRVDQTPAAPVDEMPALITDDPLERACDHCPTFDWLIQPMSVSNFTGAAKESPCWLRGRPSKHHKALAGLHSELRGALDRRSATGCRSLATDLSAERSCTGDFRK